MNTGAALPSRIRQSVIEGRYPEAEELVGQYLEDVAGAARGVGARDPAAAALHHQATQLLRWVHKMASIGRDRDGARIAAIVRTRRYHAPHVPAPPSWTFDG